MSNGNSPSGGGATPLDGADDIIDEPAEELPGVNESPVNYQSLIEPREVQKLTWDLIARNFSRTIVLAVVLSLVAYTTYHTVELVRAAIELDKTGEASEQRIVDSSVLIALITGSVIEVGLALRYITMNLFPKTVEKGEE